MDVQEPVEPSTFLYQKLCWEAQGAASVAE